MDDLIKETLKQALKEAIREEREELADKSLSIPVDKLGFSVRTSNVFRDNNITTVGDIMLLGKNGLKQLRNFGRLCVEEVEYKLQELNLEIK